MTVCSFNVPGMHETMSKNGRASVDLWRYAYLFHFWLSQCVSDFCNKYETIWKIQIDIFSDTNCIKWSILKRGYNLIREQCNDEDMMSIGSKLFYDVMESRQLR